VQEGRATLTVGDATIDASGGQILVAPAGAPRKFVTTGSGPRRQLDKTQFAVLPGTAHSPLPGRADLLLPDILPFLDAPMAKAG
jgi:hypothetical protein